MNRPENTANSLLSQLSQHKLLVMPLVLSIALIAIPTTLAFTKDSRPEATHISQSNLKLNHDYSQDSSLALQPSRPAPSSNSSYLPPASYQQDEETSLYQQRQQEELANLEQSQAQIIAQLHADTAKQEPALPIALTPPRPVAPEPIPQSPTPTPTPTRQLPPPPPPTPVLNPELMNPLPDALPANPAPTANPKPTSSIQKYAVSNNSNQVGVNWGDLRQTSNLTATEANAMLQGTNLYGLGEAFVKAEEVYNINSIFLMSLAYHESGNNTSRIARYKNNLFGYKAYDKNPFQSAETFETLDAGIYTVAKYLSSQYLSPTGRHFSGTALKDINKRYASDKNWHRGVQATGRKLLSKLN